MRSVRCGDLALICHAGEQRALVGIAEVIRNPCPDPKNKETRIVIINVASRQKLAKPVGLEEIKRQPTLKAVDFTRPPRLSMMPVTEAHCNAVLELAK